MWEAFGRKHRRRMHGCYLQAWHNLVTEKNRQKRCTMPWREDNAVHSVSEELSRGHRGQGQRSGNVRMKRQTGLFHSLNQYVPLGTNLDSLMSCIQHFRKYCLFHPKCSSHNPTLYRSLHYLKKAEEMETDRFT